MKIRGSCFSKNLQESYVVKFEQFAENRERKSELRQRTCSGRVPRGGGVDAYL